MKRFLLPASALVLVVTACGAGTTPAPRVTEVDARLMPNVHALAMQRERAATREARRLLREFRPPPGAQRISAPANYGGALRQSGAGPSGEAVDVHRFWSVHEPLKSVTAFLRTHRLHGFERFGAAWDTRPPHYVTMSSRWPAVGRPPTRFLNVTSVGLPHRTLLRADVVVAWIYPRSPSEKVPADTREIVVHAPKGFARVTDRAEVARIIRWFDALPIAPPGIAVPCPLSPGADFTLSFRDGSGAWLAQAKLPPTSATLCNSIAFSIGGHEQRPLVDPADRASFVGRLQDLLGVKLIEFYR
jgi:hypothetical protein